MFVLQLIPHDVHLSLQLLDAFPQAVHGVRVTAGVLPGATHLAGRPGVPSAQGHRRGHLRVLPLVLVEGLLQALQVLAVVLLQRLQLLAVDDLQLLDLGLELFLQRLHLLQVIPFHVLLVTDNGIQLVEPLCPLSLQGVLCPVISFI